MSDFGKPGEKIHYLQTIVYNVSFLWLLPRFQCPRIIKYNPASDLPSRSPHLMQFLFLSKLV